MMLSGQKGLVSCLASERARLGGQPVSPFGPSALEYVPPGPGAHALPEAVLSLSLSDLWL